MILADYEPPHCDFNKVIFNFTVISEGHQADRLGIMYLGDIEIWRTSTAQPKDYPKGIRWEFWKDMTHYMSLWKKSQKITFDLGNAIDETYTATFNVTLTATFFKWDHGFKSAFRSYQLNESWPEALPADRIIPIVGKNGPTPWIYPGSTPSQAFDGNFPRNVHRAHISIAATAQGNEEFWWSNVPNSVIDTYKSTSGTLPGNTAFREVQLFIDNEIAGLAWPFPMIFSGGVAPPLHRPLVGPQVFDLKEHEIDISPWLPILCDGERHKFDLRIFAIDFDGKKPKVIEPADHWVLSAKIFLWLDGEDSVTTGTIRRLADYDFKYEEDHDTTEDVDGETEFLEYTSTMTRKLRIDAKVKSEKKDEKVIWTQSFNGSNNGWYSNRGWSQDIKSKYVGEGRTTADIEAFYTSFSYPVEAVLHYTVPHGDCDFTLEAELHQSMEITTIGETAFPFSIEPWMEAAVAFDHMGTRGTSVTAYRQGYGKFCQRNAEAVSVGTAKTRGGFKLGAVRLARPGKVGFMADPLLYARAVAAVNETIVHDEVHTWKIFKPYEFQLEQGRPHVKEDLRLNPPGAYAPLPVTRAGRWKGFMGRFMDRKMDTKEPKRVDPR